MDPADPADASRWDGYVQASPRSTLSHRLEWLRVIRRVFGHAIYPLALTDAAGDVRGVLPLVFFDSRLFGRFLVSVPFVNYGGVLADGPQDAALLLGKAEELLDDLKARHVELRHSDAPLKGMPTREHKVTLTLALKDSPDEQWKDFSAKVRNQVRKAQKSGIETRVGAAELIDDFYRVFSRNMRDLGTPVYPKSFFTEVAREFHGSCAVVSSYRDGQPVAAGMLIWNKKTVEIPWASSLREYNSLCPNNDLYWEAIRFAIRSGFETFDFGRSTPGGGTFKFKTQWGAQPVALHWQYLLGEGGAVPDMTPSNPKYRAAISIWKRLPVFLANLIGPRIVRCIP
jgi:FemAB-related protein (PEP-CTERM system-associated)